MRCPVCGGTNLRPIAPGFWQCESTVVDEHIVMGPTPGAPPHLGLGTIDDGEARAFCA